ncbi:glycosyltransferase, partial [bacterium]|nr:glycosyltransferase [bacterium]
MTVAGHLIIIPTYNESDNIEKLLDLISRTDPAAHVLIVDD